MIDFGRKLLFVHISRTGGTSIEYALVGRDWWYIDPSTKHMSARQTRARYGEDIWKTYTKFSVVRNPWDRVVSMWATKWWHQASNLKEDCSLEVFVRNLKPHSQELYNSLFYWEILNEEIDFILRFESLQGDFNSMLNSIGIESVTLSHMLKGDRKRYVEIYNEAEKNLVSEMFNKDISAFGYKF